jgi:hypothetical protein
MSMMPSTFSEQTLKNDLKWVILNQNWFQAMMNFDYKILVNVRSNGSK